jgi:enoyl-CoA hydratase
MIDVSTVEGVRVLRLAHGKASALDLELVIGLKAEIEAAASADLRALVLTGSGHIFCAGVDLFRIHDGGESYTTRYLAAFAELMVALFAAPLPVITAANGHAIAGGAVLVAAADHRLMSAGNGKFGYTELLVGVPFPPAALEMVRFASPLGLQGMLYTGATYRPEQALDRRLIDEVVQPELLMRRAMEVAEQLCRIPGGVFAATKRQLREATLRRMHECEGAFGAAVLAAWCSQKTRESIKAYLDRAVRRGLRD